MRTTNGQAPLNTRRWGAYLELGRVQAHLSAADSALDTALFASYRLPGAEALSTDLLALRKECRAVIERHLMGAPLLPTV